MRVRRLLAAAAIAAASASVGVAIPPAHACEGAPCDAACYVANTGIGRKLGLLCPA
jgi:hypothetical protein